MFKLLRKLYTIIKFSLFAGPKILSIERNIEEAEKRMAHAEKVIEEITLVLNDQQKIINHLAKIQFDLSMSQTIVEQEIKNISSSSQESDIHMLFFDEDDEFIN